MFANMKNSFVVVKQLESGVMVDKPIKLKYDPVAIENRLRQSVTALSQLRSQANRLNEDSPERLQIEHAIGNLRRRVSADILKMKELGRDVSQYEEIRTGPSPRPDYPGVTSPAPEVVTTDGRSEPVPTFEASLLSQTISPGTPTHVLQDSVYQIGKSVLGGQPSSSYQSRLSSIMPRGK